MVLKLQHIYFLFDYKKKIKFISFQVQGQQIAFYCYRLISDIILSFRLVIADPRRNISYPDHSVLFRHLRISMPVAKIILNSTTQKGVFILFDLESNSSRTNYQEQKNQQYTLLHLPSAQTHVHTHSTDFFLLVNLTKHIQYKNKTNKNLNMILFV